MSEEGRPSLSGKCFKPRLFRVPKVKNEKPGGDDQITLMQMLFIELGALYAMMKM